MFNFTKTSFSDKKEPTEYPFFCDQVKQFGFCEGPCLERHKLHDTFDKKCLNIPANCLISIQLTKILSASHFYGRIIKYSSVKDPRKDQDWIIVDDLFEKIKDELKKIYLSPDSKVLHKTPIIGEMVMIEIEQELFRAIILGCINGWFSVKVKVKLIDLGCIYEVGSDKVFVIANTIKNVRPLAVEIIVSSMEPIGDGNSVLKWPVKATSFVNNLLEPIILADLEIICKVKLILGITLWIDWMLVKKCIKCSHFACKLYQNPLLLPRELIEHNLAKTNFQLINKLFDLDKDGSIWKENLNIDECEVDKKLINQKALLYCKEKKNKSNEVIQVQWAHLSNDITYDVSVNYIVNPQCILVRNAKFFDRIDDLQRDIDKAIVNITGKQLKNVTTGTVCLALEPEGKKYNRVIIQQIYDKTAEIFYVDYGQFSQVNIETLITIPSNLIKKLPFQVIECHLSGFKDILQIDIAQNNNFIDSFLQITNTKMCLKVLSTLKDSKLTGGNCYEVVLFNDNKNINILMAKEFNTYVDDTKIQSILNSSFKCNDNESDHSEYDEEELQSQYELLMSICKNLSKTKENQIVSNSTNPSKNIVSYDKLNSINTNQNIVSNNKQVLYNETNVKIGKKYCIDCNANLVVPQCFWHQDKMWVYLKINILSINNHNISNTLDTITINVKTNSTSYSFTIVLYAYIIEEFLNCHVDFEGIHIKVQKLVKVDYQWPRLLKCSKKHKYIIYNLEHIHEHKNWDLWIRIMNKFKINALNQTLNPIIYNSDSDDSDNNDYDCEKYTTYED